MTHGPRPRTAGSPPSVVLLPGMGADAAVFMPQLLAFPGIVVPDWIPPRAGESLAAYARRFAAGLPAPPPRVLGGLSFGGMLAVEMAEVLDPELLVLISTVRDPSLLPPRIAPGNLALHVLGRPGTRLVQAAARSLVRAAGGRLSPIVRGVLLQFAEADPALLAWAARAMRGWRAPCRSFTGRVLQIHGERDFVIPPSCAPGATLVPGAGHVLTLTHPERVNALLARALAGEIPGTNGP